MYRCGLSLKATHVTQGRGQPEPCPAPSSIPSRMRGSKMVHIFFLLNMEPRNTANAKDVEMHTYKLSTSGGNRYILKRSEIYLYKFTNIVGPACRISRSWRTCASTVRCGLHSLNLACPRIGVWSGSCAYTFPLLAIVVVVPLWRKTFLRDTQRWSFCAFGTETPLVRWLPPAEAQVLWHNVVRNRQALAEEYSDRLQEG